MCWSYGYHKSIPPAYELSHNYNIPITISNHYRNVTRLNQSVINCRETQRLHFIYYTQPDYEQWIILQKQSTGMYDCWPKANIASFM